MSSCSPFPNPVSNAAIAQPRDPTPSCPTPSFLLNPRSPPHVRFFCTHGMLSLKKRRSSGFLFDAVADGRSGAVVGTGGDADDDDDDDLCPVDCVREFKTEEEFARILDKSKADGSLVVVDFYRASCGSCKYIEQGFAKLCRGSGDQQADVVFLKHNVSPLLLSRPFRQIRLPISLVFWSASSRIFPELSRIVRVSWYQKHPPITDSILRHDEVLIFLTKVSMAYFVWFLMVSIMVIDEYDEQSEVAERLRVKMEFMQSVPLFHFYKNGVLLEAFPTRDKERIDAAILKYTSIA
ncbi:hypothetical protein BHM03_00058966 [Ensete ventricosum]|nr:hypothetical protein BHM03_00058966 [Ensete ventricosum]